jgi:hypothetical protein
MINAVESPIEQVGIAQIMAETHFAAKQLYEANKVRLLVGKITNSPFMNAMVEATVHYNIPFIGYLNQSEILVEDHFFLKGISSKAVKICLSTECLSNSTVAMATDLCKWV